MHIESMIRCTQSYLVPTILLKPIWIFDGGCWFLISTRRWIPRLLCFSMLDYANSCWAPRLSFIYWRLQWPRVPPWFKSPLLLCMIPVTFPVPVWNFTSICKVKTEISATLSKEHQVRPYQTRWGSSGTQNDSLTEEQIDTGKKP